MKKLLLVLCVSLVVLSMAAFASAQLRGYQEGSSQYGAQDQQQGQYGRQDRSQRQYGRQDQWDQQGRSMPGTRSGGRQTAMNFSRASDLMDKKVQGQQGEELGEVDDLIITRNGRVAYLIVSRGGVLGVGDNYIPIPFRHAQFDRQLEAVILPNVSKQSLENAPTISRNEWQKLEDPGFERQVFSYYGQQAGQQGMEGYRQGMDRYQQQREYQQQPGAGTYQQQQRPMQQQRSGQTGR